ncbi:hypothetical protein FB446DRAFT_749980 [Lentinula raphanica]|nr:hypothetical protein FB446DRAFT_749980 [Lentinula raphanica]
MAAYSDSSFLSTPALSSPSSASSSNDTSSFHSALSTDDWIARNVGGGAPDCSNSPSGHAPPLPLNFPSDARFASASVLKTVKNIASSVDRSFGTSFGEQRRPNRRKPSPLPLVDPFDEMLTLRLDNASPSLPSGTNVPPLSRGRSMSIRPVNTLRRRDTSHESSARMGRLRLQRMNSLPSIPSATLFSPSEPILNGPDSQKGSAVENGPLEKGEERNHTSFRTRTDASVRERNTKAFASLAWTGTLPSALPSSFPISNTDLSSSAHPMSWTLTSACRSTWSLIGSSEPSTTLLNPASATNDDGSLPLLRSDLTPVSDLDERHQRRRWTLAMIITDDQISDEKLVDKLERMMVGSSGEQSSGWSMNTGLCSPLSPVPFSAAIPSSNVCGSPRDELEMDTDRSYPGHGDHSDTNVSYSASSTKAICSPSSNNHHSQSTMWRTARRTLLICRELVLTERSYLSYLRLMFSQETTTPSSPLLLVYLPALILASERFLSQIENNPSAAGVAGAFLSCGEELESAFVGWCGVIGELFAGPCNAPSIRRARTSGGSVGWEKNRHKEISGSKQGVSWGKKIRFIRSRSWSMSKRAGNVLVGINKDSKGRAGNSTHSFRELAILPIQRVTRYTLLFRDLTSFTPASPSRETVLMAYDLALELAQKCDRAQGNLTFFHECR